MSVNADQTFSGDSIFENIYVHGKLVSQEEAITIFRKILAKEGITITGDKGLPGSPKGDGTLYDDAIKAAGQVTIIGAKYDVGGWDGWDEEGNFAGTSGRLLVSGVTTVATANVANNSFHVGVGGTVLSATTGIAVSYTHLTLPTNREV